MTRVKERSGRTAAHVPSMSTLTAPKRTAGAHASAVSRIISARAGKPTLRRVRVLQAADGSTTVFTPNGARHQAAAVSRARRALREAGYVVEAYRGGDGPIPGAPHLFYLTVLGKNLG